MPVRLECMYMHVLFFCVLGAAVTEGWIWTQYDRRYCARDASKECLSARTAFPIFHLQRDHMRNHKTYLPRHKPTPHVSPVCSPPRE